MRYCGSALAARYQVNSLAPASAGPPKETSYSDPAGVGAADPKAINFEDHKNVFEDAVKAIREDREPAINGEQSRKSVEIILAIYESALAGGKLVGLPLKKTPELRKFD